MRATLFEIARRPRGLLARGWTRSVWRAGSLLPLSMTRDVRQRDQSPRTPTAARGADAIVPHPQPMGWNSWNCWGSKVSAEKVLQSARGMVESGLINHGWTYINIDDAWQDKRGGKFNAIQGNDKFPDMKELCDAIHGMGLKAGIYSTPP